jgi:hypothetical protein
MHKIHIVIFCCIVLFTACSKENGPAALPTGSISIQLVNNKDSMQVPLPIATDTAFVLGLKAVLSGNASTTDHWVNFAVDTTKLAAFKGKYGNALLLPATSYYFYKPMTRIAAGASISDSAQLNIVLQTKLEGYTTYVLPVVVQSVDGNVDGAASGQVLYYVLQTGKPSIILKTGWTIAGYSSQNTTTVAATQLLDDNNTTTYWLTATSQQMPQWVSINFGKDVTFTAVTYYFPTALAYPKNGGYPTSIQIETSTNGTTWTSKGIFAGNIVNNMQTLPVGLITARYLRFTSLASVKYSGFDVIGIAGISVLP